MKIDELNEFKKRLRSYKKSDIEFTFHAEIRAIYRKIDLEEVKRNIINPNRLVYFKEAIDKKGKKYECYFVYSKNYCHKYALSLNGKVIIITIISINKDWQRTVK